MHRPIEELIWEVRRLFRELAQLADEVLSPLGVTAAERALLEFLAREQAPVSLAEIARKRAVSRQHIHQTLARLDPRWVIRADDPADGRSLGLNLSEDGRAFWERIRAVDIESLQRIEERLDKTSLRSATETLRHLRDALDAIRKERG